MIFTNELPSNSMNIVVEAGNVYLMGILTKEEAERAKKVASNTNGVKQVFVFFDIISDAERLRLEREGKADRSQPNTNVNN
jgi:osmotically-inducible protein OsmY